MEVYRIANFVMQLICVVFHLLFIIGFFRRRQPTPIWGWFFVVTTGLFMLISGRFMESVAYLFFPVNGFYTFAVYWQFVGTTYATFAYLFWNLHLAGLQRAAESKALKAATFAVSTALCVVICTNHHFHLFYKKLVMGEQVVHGVVHTPWIVWVYGMLAVGFVISLVDIIRRGGEKFKRILVFSMFPLFPALAALIRSVVGVDELDYTPLVVAVSVFCMYLIVFRRKYVNLIPQSMESALEQTESAVIVWDPDQKAAVYSNQAAKKYLSRLDEILSDAPGPIFEKTLSGRVLRVSVKDHGDLRKVVAVTDVTELEDRREKLEEEIAGRDAAVRELEDRRRNIDAYLEALYQIPDLKQKQELLGETKKEAIAALEEMAENLRLASEDISACEPYLKKNIDAAGPALEKIRRAVSALKEGM